MILVICFVLNGCGGGNKAIESPKPFASWSGTIAFRQDNFASEQPDLWLITPSEKKLTSHITSGWGSVRWSPDGNYLAFIDNKSNLVMVNKDGSMHHQFGRVDKQFSWTNNSQYVISGVYDDGIYSYSISGEQSRALETGIFAYDHNPVSSRDGQWVYGLLHTYGTTCDIYRIKTDKLIAGNNYHRDCDYLVELTDTGYNEPIQLEPTNDGKIIVGQGTSIYLLYPEEKIIEKLPIDGALYLKISPSGLYLGAIATNQVNITKIGTWETIVKIPVPETPFFEEALVFTWAPDSRSIAISSIHYNRQDFSQSYNIMYIWRFNDRRLQEILRVTAGTNSQQSLFLQATGEMFSSLSWKN